MQPLVRTARITGLLYLGLAVAGGLGFLAVRSQLFVDGDPNTVEQGLSIEYQGANASPLRRMQLDSAVGVLTVEYLDNRTGRWYAATQVATIQPIALRFTLSAAEGDSIPRLLQVPFIFRMGDAQQARGR